MTTKIQPRTLALVGMPGAGKSLCAEYLEQKGYFKILGRNSVDIIKSGAYKISALEIENILIKHPLIKECAFVGLEDKKWGEIVAVSVTIVEKEDLSLEDLQKWSSAKVVKL